MVGPGEGSVLARAWLARTLAVPPPDKVSAAIWVRDPIIGSPAASRGHASASLEEVSQKRGAERKRPCVTTSSTCIRHPALAVVPSLPQECCRILRMSHGALPGVVPPKKLRVQLTRREATDSTFRELAALCQGVVSFEEGEQSMELAGHLLPPACYSACVAPIAFADLGEWRRSLCFLALLSRCALPLCFLRFGGSDMLWVVRRCDGGSGWPMWSLGQVMSVRYAQMTWRQYILHPGDMRGPQQHAIRVH